MVTQWLNRIFSSQTQVVAPAHLGATRLWLGGERVRMRRVRRNGSQAAAHSKGTANANGAYVLATGEAAAHRLNILNNLYGTGSCRVLLDAGLRRGMRVADLGCGVGTMTKMIGEFVGPQGYVVGMDASAAQIAEAQSRLPSDATNISFVEASATGTGWPDESFDLVYCRFLLLHLQEPERALAEMRRLLKPGGVLVCEDGDLTSAGSEPASALGAFAELFGLLGPHRGVDYTLGRRLFPMVAAAGFAAPEITFNQPVIARGENKRLLELSVAEAGPAIVEAGLLRSSDLKATLAEMRRLGEDEGVLAVMPRMAQVWARKC